ncbi:unnamed protein product [Owenia fusiformis]|uniref:Uncharacterized protein n=1 Tax=Owenia fusiformis TaxID=6347 RepID=A0A8J1UHL7_OWEFU|nr:unnamed protein product [Owenia fusiformis]
MRTVSFVERLEFDFPGNLFNQALGVGDVDNDKCNEIVAGNMNGELMVFKGRDSKPWRKASDLGMITCIGVGDICNKGKNMLVSLSAEGWCHIFCVKGDGEEGNGDMDRCMQPSHIQHLPANSRVMIIADVDNDGKSELVIGYSDRVVRSFRWSTTADPDSFPLGKFIPVEKWQLAAQIGSITTNTLADGTVDVMVAQPGGTFVSLVGSKDIHTGAGHKDKPQWGPNTSTEDLEEDKIQGPTLVYHPLGAARARNPSVTTEIIGNISKSKKHVSEEERACYYAVCTLDGTLSLVEDDKIQWSFLVDHQLFGLTKLDVTGDGTEEVVVCSWDGQTYIVNHSKEVARFQFEDNIAAFCAGHYALSDEKNVPCLIYVTFSQQILVYYNMQMPHVELANLIDTMDQREGIPELLQCLSVDPSNKQQLRQLYHWALYGGGHQSKS